MTSKLSTALQNVEMTYAEVVEVANDIANKHFKAINAQVAMISSQINALTIDQIRNYILELQLQAFSISEVKEKSALKAELAQALQKEQFAIKFNGADGTGTIKEKIALVETSSEVVAEALYNLIANLFKTKLDQVHRLVDALKSILMSRMQESKYINMTTANDIPATFGNKYKGE